MRRILVIGSPGAGKSTLAQRLAVRLDLPLIHLDREYFGPGWAMPSKEEWRDKVARLASRPAWVMDGNYASTFDIRVPRAEAIVWLDVPRWQCALSVLWRVVDPARSHLAVPDAATATADAVEHAARHVVHETRLRALVEERSDVLAGLDTRASAITAEWGAAVLDVDALEVELRAGPELLRLLH